jgi:sec-independent protein translocase protein TatC
MSKAWKQLGLGEPTLHFANPVDLFVAYMQIAMVFGLLGASPWVFWQVWGFIAPGLYSREKRYAIPFVLASTVCFVGGALFGYSMMLPAAFEQFLGMAGALPAHTIRVQPTIMIDEYMGFTTRLLLAFGLVFEVPVVVAFLAMAGLVNWKQLLNFGRWWILIASIIAALLTPPDVGSQMLMLIPLVVLYYLSVGVAFLLGPKPAAAEATSAAATDAR